MKKITLYLLLSVTYLCNAQTGLTSYSTPPGLSIANPTSGNVLDCDPQGNAWVAFYLSGFGKFDGSNWTVYNTSNSALRTNTIRALCHDHQNYLWLATDSGLARFDGTTWMWYDSSNTILGTNHIVNLYASANKVLLLARYINPTTFKFFSFNSSTGAFQQIDVTPTVGPNQENLFNSLCISPQGNFYMGSPSQKKIIKVDAAGNQTLIDLTGVLTNNPGRYFFDVDNVENIWLSHKIFIDPLLTQHTMQNCPLYPDALIAFGYPLYNGDYIRRGYQDIPWFIRSSSLTFANANADQYYIFPYNLVLPNGFRSIVTAPSGESWLLGVYPPLYKFNPSIYSHTSVVSNFNIDYLDINEVVTSTTPLGDMHWDPSIGAGPQYMVPKCSGVHSVFSSAMWIGGLDANDTLHLAAQTYRQDGLDFWPGPLDTLSASIDSVTSAVYNHVWKISREDIVNFIYQYQLGNVTNMTYPVPPVILSWPAHGTGNFSRNLAPFADNNNDGNYNPYDGDYPKIKGDQMCYSIFNDAIYPHDETGGNPIGLEFHKSSYESACPQIADSNRSINYTTYYDFEIFNRSDTTYHNMYIGIYTDVDLGNYLDDYVGCDTMLHAGFVYNGDNDDGGYTGYGLNPPMQNVTILDSPEAIPNDGVDNDRDGITDEAGEKNLLSNFMTWNNDFTNMGNPENAIHYYYFLQSKWKNGAPVLSCNGSPTHYMFPGTPYDTTQCNETYVGNIPYDRRFLVTSGPFTLPAHGKTNFTVAYVWTRDELNPNGINTSIARNRSDLMKIRQWFAADTIPSCLQLFPGVEEKSQLKPLFNLYPNPADESISIQYVSKSLKPVYKIYDVGGRLIKSGKLRENISAINVSALRPGNYVFEISDGDVKTTRRFIKE